MHSASTGQLDWPPATTELSDCLPATEGPDWQPRGTDRPTSGAPTTGAPSACAAPASARGAVVVLAGLWLRRRERRTGAELAALAEDVRVEAQDQEVR